MTLPCHGDELAWLVEGWGKEEGGRGIPRYVALQYLSVTVSVMWLCCRVMLVSGAVGVNATCN
ncbi:hypothetical protein E2C01_044309 [Portunus trituberculatus]|uniref:Uncharacterized protein n=1 Tax=Portunus trituberculatus TaxID=210409 RepID=A0A5B7FRS6_PORTR|nr:hypothetical protein [Portunus trituberculatus]